MEKRGIIELTPELILRFLDYNDGGRIITINHDISRDIIQISLEHPEMPEVPIGGLIPIIKPSYITYTDALGHNVTLRERNGGRVGRCF